MRGIVKAPVTAIFGVACPAVIPIKALLITDVIAGPLLVYLPITFPSSMKKTVPPSPWSMPPKKTNKNMTLAEMTKIIPHRS